MDEQIARLTERVARQEERIAQLERRLGRNSRNSSQPPSQDPPGAPPRRGKDRSGRKQGGQPGHEGQGRPLLPAWAVDEVVEHWPDRCECGHVFVAAERVAVGDPARHQLEELPAITVRVIEHQCQRVRCPDCGAKQRGALPTEVAASAFGPRLQAAIVTLSVRNRISRRDVVELCEQLFAARICTGSVEAILQRASDALEVPYDELLAEVRAAAHELGEHGLRICAQLFWAWEIYQHAGDRRELKRRIRALRRELKALLGRHASSAARYRRTRRFARNLLKLWPALWTFADHAG